MRINFAHINAPAAAGGSINYAVFDARSTSGTDADNAAVLADLAAKARATLNLDIDQAALAYREHGRLKFWGTRTLVDHLARIGLPRWTHWIDA